MTSKAESQQKRVFQREVVRMDSAFEFGRFWILWDDGRSMLIDINKKYLKNNKTSTINYLFILFNYIIIYGNSDFLLNSESLKVLLKVISEIVTSEDLYWGRESVAMVYW